MGRLVWRGIWWVVIACAVAYVADWGVWEARVLAGGGYRSMQVTKFVVAPLKGGKEEYYPDGKTEVECTISLLPQGFPQTGGQPCWWVAKHPVVFER